MQQNGAWPQPDRSAPSRRQPQGAPTLSDREWLTETSEKGCSAASGTCSACLRGFGGSEVAVREVPEMCLEFRWIEYLERDVESGEEDNQVRQ